MPAELLTTPAWPHPPPPQSAKLDTELRSARAQLTAATSQAQDANRKWQAAETQLRQAESQKEELVKTAQVGWHTLVLHSFGRLANQPTALDPCAVSVPTICCIKVLGALYLHRHPSCIH